MIRSFAVALVSIVLVSLLGPLGGTAAQSGNQSFPIDFMGAAPGLDLDLFLNSGKVADVPINSQGDGSWVLDLGNMGKTRLQTYVDVCDDGRMMKVLVVDGQPAPEDQGCSRRMVGAAFWSDCGVTRITLDLTKFGMRVVGCGSFYTEPKFLAPVGGAAVLGGLLLGGGGDSNSTFVTAPIVVPTVTVPSNTTVAAPPVTTPPVTTPTPAPPIDFTVALAPSYTHPGGNTSIFCALIATTPPQAGASYTALIGGPGVQSGGSLAGVLNAGGRAVTQTVITSTGNYTINATVVAGSVSRTASASANVQSSTGTCPSP